MKIIIIGPSLSGKTTLVSELRKDTSLHISEMDEELTVLNQGEFPSNLDYKNNVLVPKIIEKILRHKDIIFFTNTNYFSETDLLAAKKNGFKIFFLNVDYGELVKRNQQRVQNQAYEDQSNWLKGMLAYQEEIQGNNLVDVIIDANKPVLEVVLALRNYF